MNSLLNTEIFDELLAALQHPNPNVRAGAAIALGKTKSAKAVEPLVDLLEDPVHPVYVAAVPWPCCVMWANRLVSLGV
jgi:HEAT repeat protein